MNSIALLGYRMVHKISHCVKIYRQLCNQPFHCDDEYRSGFELVEEPLKKMCVASCESVDIDSNEEEVEDGRFEGKQFLHRNVFLEKVRIDAERVLEVIGQDGPEFDSRLALNELHVRPSAILVREVLLRMLKEINCENKARCAKLAYKFFLWCEQQEGYCHTANSYHLVMQIFAECDELKAMWRLVDEMIEKGFPATARTFHILICSCGEAGFTRRLVMKFIKSKSFNYRPFRHSYNAILHCLLVLNQYKLIEWVHRKMLLEGFSSDVLTYNIVMLAKYRLGKLYQFNRLLDEMGRSGLSPDFHTYNILLHVLGKGDKPLGAFNLLNNMKETGVGPTVLHFTTLIDGLSRAGNMDACKYFFNEMIKSGCMPDVVAYTVMITGYVVAAELESAQEMFQEMISRGQIPNVFTYNSMIRGLCMAGKFDEACSMLKEMEANGCSPNFVVYTTLVSNLRNAGKLAEAHEVIRQMREKGKYVHLVSKFKVKRRKG